VAVQREEVTPQGQQYGSVKIGTVGDERANKRKKR
jgi:hypothetical protein